MKYTKQEWVEIGKRWSVAYDAGQSFKKFCEEAGLSTPHASYALRKLGFKIRLPRKGFLRGQLCEHRNHKD